MKDHRGTEINVGDKVAYNYQGQIAIGWIKDIKMIHRYGYSRHVYIIERQFPGGGPGEESKVTSHLNLMVIFEKGD